jgi:ATP-dependent Lon protease
MKILYPDGKATAAEIEELLSFAMEARRRVREHILRIDDTFKANDFSYGPLNGGASVTVLTPEERQYPAFSHRVRPAAEGATQESPLGDDGERAFSIDAPPNQAAPQAPPAMPQGPQPGHVVIPENTKGWSYRRLFANYLAGAKSIQVRDPYVRHFHQIRNMMELLRVIHEVVADGDEVAVRLTTQSESETADRQKELLDQLVAEFTGSRVAFSWGIDPSANFHARSITTDTGWKISLDRGLDFFQRFETGQFSIAQAIQEERLTKGAEITYLKI